MKNLALRNFLIWVVFSVALAVLMGSGVYFALNVENADKIVKVFSRERPFLGIEYNDALVVVVVRPNSPAEEAGIKAGDRIISINGVKMLSWQEVKQTLLAVKLGRRVEIVVRREVPSRGEYQWFKNIALNATLIRWPEHIPVPE